ncbi:UDP-glucose 6-dehydrogenase [Virgisporangium aliadipatigenens]|uniref:UDP-glucose 6-dehydrogenase n=1 Tax=Virgisporangium aliadipatigenens TaxID=741659 RepID=A0A8J3YY50_9ACTN|nr:hypothetical protein [Virgisporangium aliadipatigenens]GIJ51915.1 UDP-glucose 6-dehydrogenase [Virgisporangium aliadipatigenens]
MASVGLVGLGKLGLPTAITLAQSGHRVLGYDLDPARMSLDSLAPYELDAERAGPLSATFDDTLDLHFRDLAEVVNDSDCVLVAVETPHGPLYEGITPLPQTRADFSYEALTAAVRAVVAVANRPIEIGVISTVLPGGVRRHVLPYTAGHSLVYCPQFIAMGTVAADLRTPEFVLLGYGESKPLVVKEVLESMRRNDCPTFEVSYESAELAKVSYNTFVGAKVTVANVVQQTAHQVGANAADVFAILRSSTRRLASPTYIGPGMGDGGPCHPRDNIALSWLAGELDLGADLFSALMFQREAYVGWLGDTFVKAAQGRPLVVLGTAYKPGVPIETGSSTVLMVNLAAAKGVDMTLVATPDDIATSDLPQGPAAYFIGCPERAFAAFDFPAGSVVVDPWHVVGDLDDVTVIRVGEHR